MVANYGIIPLFLVALLCTIASTETNVPVYIWNIDTDEVISAIPTISAHDLVSKLSPAIGSKKLIALFVQDELSTEDFKGDELKKLHILTQEKENDGIVYAPSVSGTVMLPEILSMSGFALRHIKSSQDLPETITENTVLVIDLPKTELGSSRSDSLKLSADVINNVYEVLQSQHPGVVGIFTAAKNSKLMADLSRLRITRSTRADDDYKNDFLNDTNQVYFYIETAPVLKIYAEQTPTGTWLNITLDNSPTISSTMVNNTDGTTNNTVVLSYSNVNNTDASAVINMVFMAAHGYWSLMGVSLDFTSSLNNGIFNVKNGSLIAKPITTPLGSSYHCTPNLLLASYGFQSNLTTQAGPAKIALEMNGFQLQPFKISALNKFGDWYDCQGFFTEGIWTAIFIGLVLAMMLAWAASMVDDIKGPDRFDDPKGKTITVTATD